MSSLAVLSPGVFTTLQDSGRTNYQHMGVPPSGPMDQFAFCVANALVRNQLGEGALELTLIGGHYRVEQGPCRIAVTGNFDVSINGVPTPAWCSYDLQPSDELRIGLARRGLRGYLAVAGGFVATPILGSVSTLVRAGLGGFAGRSLIKNDLLSLRNPDPFELPPLVPSGTIDPGTFPWYQPGPIRVVMGPQADYFCGESITQFLKSPFHIRPESDRMGYRLAGPALQHAKGHDIISDPICRGSIQVPGNGQLIIALNDRQTTGGYPKIATIVRADLIRVGQMKPGDVISFTAISVAEAEALWFSAQARMNSLLQYFL